MASKREFTSSPAVPWVALVVLPGLFAPVLLEPHWGGWGIAMPVLVAGLLVAWLRRRPSLPARLAGPATALAAMVVALALLELGARLAVGLGWVESYRPMRTLVPPGTEDWRLAHITADRHREADPVLLWRPAPRPPYNTQRMKGPVVGPKAEGVVRILCYGDSNTDGPDRGGWPELLGQELARRGHRAEVLNAGVAGYSSHQGLSRFRQQVAELEPDWVLVSFGWNDLATASGPPDHEYRPPPAWRLRLDRLLLEYELTRAARAALAQPPPEGSELGSRVPLAEYRRNLAGFVQTAREHGARTLLLTRPYSTPTAEMEASLGWRGRVPVYNRALLKVAAGRDALAFDVQGAFEARAEDFVDQCHFTPGGHARMARLLADELEGAGLGRGLAAGGPGKG